MSRESDPAETKEEHPMSTLTDGYTWDALAEAVLTHDAAAEHAAWHPDADAVAAVAAEAAAAVTGIADPDRRALATSDALDRIMAATLDVSLIDPRVPSARLILKGRIEYAITCRRAVVASPVPAAVLHYLDLAEQAESQARHLLAGCYGPCCGFSVPQCDATCPLSDALALAESVM